MKLLLLVLSVIALSASFVYGQGSGQNLYDPTTPDFQDRHAWFIGTVANDRDSGKVWVQQTQLIAPINFSTGQIDPFTGLFTSIQQYTWYQDNWYDESKGAFCSLQAWPRVLVDESVAWALQEICVNIETPFYKVDTTSSGSGGPVIVEGPSTYNIEWISPPLVESIFVQGTERREVALSHNAGCISWWDPATGKELLNECLTNAIAGEFRLYSLNVVLEALPGVPSTSFLVWNTFRSTASVPPQVITDAFAAYRAGEIPLSQDPNAPAGSDVQIYLYVPSAERREARNHIHNGATLVTSFEGLKKAVENSHH